MVQLYPLLHVSMKNVKLFFFGSSRNLFSFISDRNPPTHDTLHWLRLRTFLAMFDFLFGNFIYRFCFWQMLFFFS